MSRRADALWIAGASSAGYLYLFLNLVLHVPISYLWWFWSVGLDGTHIFATASRTYFDRAERRRRRALFWGSLAFFFALGPALVLAGAKGWLALLVGIWAYYHVVRQHYGFMVLYKVKNKDLDPRDNRLDRLLLFTMLAVPPFLRFFIRHPEELGLKLHWQAAVPTVTIVHNIQYHGLVWLHNRNRYGQPDARAAHGFVPAAAARSLALYAAMALLFSLLYRVPGYQFSRVSDLAFGFFCGFGLTHYYLDSRIWRVRHDPGLRQALALA